MIATRRQLNQLLFGFAALSAGFSVFLFSGLTVDDSLIVVRYAERASLGEPLTFNDGEAINALTSIVHGYLMALFSALGVPPIVAWKIAGGILLAATALIVGRAFAALGIGWIAYLIVFQAPPVVFWAFAGLETPLVVFLATLIAWLFLTDQRQGFIIPLSLLLFFTRYDSVLFTLPIATYLVCLCPDRGRQAVIAVGCAVVAGFGFVGLQAAYGSIIPTSFFTKTPEFSIYSASRNGLYILLNAILIFTPVAIASVAAGPKLPKKDYRLFVICVSLSFVCFYGLTAATKHMMFNFRLLAPYICVVFILIQQIIAKSDGRCVRKFAILLPMTLGIWAAFISLNAMKIYFDSAEGVIPINEGKYFGIRDYSRSITTMQAQAKAVLEHSSIHVQGRSPILKTNLGGVLPERLPGFYVFETLVSYRSDDACYPSVHLMAPYADYIHMLVPTHGPIEDQLGLVHTYTIVSEASFFMGRQLIRSVIVYNPAVRTLALPSRSFDPCPSKP